MRTIVLLLANALLALALRAETPASFQPLFNGKDLRGWEGSPDLWSVKEGVIDGRTRADAPLAANTFLIWKGAPLKNFELRATFRFLDNNEQRTANSGVQYRSKVLDASHWVVGGYQGDMDAAGQYVGMLYEEKGRGILAKPGERVRLLPGEGNKPKIEVIGNAAPKAVVASAFNRDGWNELIIVANGNHLRHILNGVVTADVIDDDPAKASAEGILALQVHKGPPMHVQFKDILLRRLP